MKRVALEVAAGVAFFAIVLGWLGPRLDAGTYADYGYTPEQQALYRGFDRDAQKRCAQDRERGENAGYVITADGAVVCTDKRGRRGKHPITIAIKTEAR